MGPGLEQDVVLWLVALENSRIREFTFHNRLNAGSCDDDDASAGHLYTDIQIPDLTASHMFTLFW